MSEHDVTNLLSALRREDGSGARERLYECVYGELRAMAAAKSRRERAELDVGATALVQEAYLKLAGHEASFENRRHFFGAAARAMHQVLVDRVREAGAEKRGGGLRRVELHESWAEAIGGASGDAAGADAEVERDWPKLQECLEALEACDPRGAEVVRLRFFGGVAAGEIAAMLGVAERTVERDWRHARAWLTARLAGDGASEGER